MSNPLVDNIQYIDSASIQVAILTGSLQGTASYALTASLLLGSVSTAVQSAFATQSLYATQSLFSTSSLTSSAVTNMAVVRTGLNVKNYGAVGDGTTDDTVAIQQALSASWTSGVSNRGVELFFPAGVYKTSAPISCSGNNVFLVGAGVGGTALYPQHAAGDVLQFGSLATGVSYVGLMNMSIISGVTRTAGASINLTNADDVLIKNFNISTYATGCFITGSSIKVRIDEGEINSGLAGTGVGILVANGLAGDTYIGNIVMSNTPSTPPLAGVNIQQTGHTSIFRLNVTSCTYGLLINPTSSQDVSYLFCDHTLFDSCASASALFYPGNATSARIRSAVFTNSWFSGTSQGPGLLFTASGIFPPIIDGVKFIGCRSLNNGTQGAYIGYSGSNNITWDACTFAGNSALSSGTYYAIDMVPSVSEFVVVNSILSQGGTSGNSQKGAINVPNGTGSFIITNNDVSPNITQPYINIGLITGSYVISNNIGSTVTILNQSTILSTGNVTLTNAYSNVLMSGSSASTATLPNAQFSVGSTFNIKNVTPFNVTVTGSQNIDNNSKGLVLKQWTSVQVISNGTQWFIV